MRAKQTTLTDQSYLKDFDFLKFGLLVKDKDLTPFVALSTTSRATSRRPAHDSGP